MIEISKLRNVCNVNNRKANIFCRRKCLEIFNERFNCEPGFRIDVSTGISHICVRIAPNLLRISVSRGVWLDLSGDTTQLPSLWCVKIPRLFRSFHLLAFPREATSTPYYARCIRSECFVDSHFSLSRNQSFPRCFPRPTADPALFLCNAN